ncbi:MAG: FtsX-like permease family protein [Firmicutes bacterium]|nr:FtsX-like permease family protein [Bacillota bacterium]
MKNTLFKTTLREIRGSLGRWMAILAIVALGVGFFAGLKACRPAFLETGNTYLQEHKFFDYQLISTLGLEDEDVDIINDVYQVGTAEGSYSADVLVQVGNDEASEIGTKFLTISKNINTPSLVAGSMPSNDDECLGDALYFSEDDIGKKILVSKNNEENTLDILAYDTYTLTGIANSPLFLNFERGSTSVGDGTVAGFIILTPDGFSSEVYTEIYVKLAESAFIFTDEYERIMKDAEKPLENALKKCSERRYNAIIDDARQKVEDGRAELESKKKELEQAESLMGSGNQSLSSGLEILEQSKKYYESSIKQIEATRDLALSQLDNSYRFGLITEEQYKTEKARIEKDYNNTKASLDSLKKQIDDAEAELKAGEKQLNDAKKQIKDGKVQIAKAERDLAKAEKEIDNLENPTTYVLSRETNIGYVCFDSDISIVDGIANVFPIFFFLVAALVCMTTMSRMVEEQRTQIGVFKSLGYSSGQILGKYIFYSGSSALIGGIAGFFIGVYLFTWVIWTAYGMMYNFADIIFYVDWLLGILLVLASILCSVGTTVYSCYAELKQVPAQLIRPKAPPAGKRILLERITFIWKRLKFLHKVSARNIFRYKKRFFMMVLGICGCTALLVAAFGVNDSIRDVVSTQYERILHIDYTVTFNKDMTEADMKEFTEDNKDVVADALFLNTKTVDAHADGAIKSVNLVVCNADDPVNDFISIYNDDGPISYPSKGEGVINTNLAQSLGLGVGDEITVYDSDMNEITVEITALCENFVYNYLYITMDTYADVYGESEVNSAYVQTYRNDEGEPKKLHEGGAKLMDSLHVSAVTVTDDFRARIENIMQSLDYIILLVVLCAAALAFIVLYNLTNINITERIREIATIKVLGFYSNETSAYVFRENIVLTLISALVGLPLGNWLHYFIMTQIKVDLLSWDIHIEPLSYVMAVLGTFLFAMFVNMVMKKKISKISMTESLKSIE